MKAHQQTIGKNDEWLTPPWLLEPLGHFDLDPCAPHPSRRPWKTAHCHYWENGLERDWFGRVWCNPPFNRNQRSKWMAKMASHGNGILLIPAAGETRAFAEHVWGQCDGILILNKRPHFHYVDGTEAKANSGCTICLIAYGPENFETLKQSGLGFALVEA